MTQGRSQTALYEQLFAISKQLLCEDDDRRTAEIIGERVFEATGAEHGVVVVRDGDSFDVRFERGQPQRVPLRFSRNLVRQVIETGEPVHTDNLALDSRFAAFESAQAIGACSVLVVPLKDEGRVFAVIYLQSGGTEGFDEEARRFLSEFAQVATLFIKRAMERAALRQRTASLERDLLARHQFPGILTHDPGMLALLKVVGQVADSDSTVLIQGETGTGKELIAQALHLNSGRRSRPLVVVHCAALPGTILESELFGHTRGAFTGAQRDRPGRIASAAGGTLFLDEIAEIPVDLQAKLLRFLESGEIQRLGSDRTERVPVRVVAATHQDLARLVAMGRFRQDLYYRLKVMELRVPPLRERKGDLPLLIDHFLRKHWRRRPERPRLTPQALHALTTHHYPGNVRELGHVVERSCLLATGPEIGVELLPADIAGTSKAGGVPPIPAIKSGDLGAAREAAIKAVEQAFLAELMARCGGNVSLAARDAGMRRSYLQKLLAKHRPTPS